MNRTNPSRGEVWLVRLDPTVGHEQAKTRPCLVISSNYFNKGRSGLLMVLPITSTNRNIPFHIPINPPRGKILKTSFILCDQLRTVSIKRFTGQCWALLDDDIIEKVEEALRELLELY